MKKLTVRLLGVFVASFIAVIAASPSKAEQKIVARDLKKEWPLTMQQGSTVVVRIPTNYWKVETNERNGAKLVLPFPDDKGRLPGESAYFIDVEDLLTERNWTSGGFLSCSDFTLTKAFRFTTFYRASKLDYTEIELRSGTRYLRLHFAHSPSERVALDSEFSKLVVPGHWIDFEESEEFRTIVFPAQEEKIFTGPLHNLSYTEKVSLLNTACSGSNQFATRKYKEKIYFSVSIESDETVYNTNRLNASARSADAINQQVIGRIKDFKQPILESHLDGIRFDLPIDYQDFVNGSAMHRDRLEIYLPLDAITKFTNADITSQQLVDAGIVLLNGDRVQVILND